MGDKKDWAAEAKKLDDSSNLEWWNPPAKTADYKIHVVNDVGEFEFKKGEETIKKYRIDITVDGKGPYKFSMSYASTIGSLWGQIVTLGKERDGIEGEDFTLKIEYDKFDKKRKFRIKEVLEMLGDGISETKIGEDGESAPPDEEAAGEAEAGE